MALLCVIQNALAKHWRAAQRALRIKPDLTEPLNIRGTALQDLKRLDEALESYDRALKIDPIMLVHLTTAAGALRDLKRFGEALASYDRALNIKPDDAEAHFNLSLCCLLMGDFARGWDEL